MDPAVLTLQGIKLAQGQALGHVAVIMGIVDQRQIIVSAANMSLQSYST